MDIEGYKEEMRGLNVMRKGRRVAPHKAVLLLAVVELIERGEIDSPLVSITPELERTFRRIWREKVGEGSGFNCSMHYPFYHLHTASFWELVKQPGCDETTDVTSMAALKRQYVGAVLPKELFSLLQEENLRREFKELLLDSYLFASPGNGIGMRNTLILLAAALIVA